MAAYPAHYASGWFRVAGGGCLVLLPPKGDGAAVLLETTEPEKFVVEVGHALACPDHKELRAFHFQVAHPWRPCTMPDSALSSRMWNALNQTWHPPDVFEKARERNES